MPAHPEPLDVVSHRSRSVTESAYRKLERSPQFLHLVESGVVSLKRSKNLPWGISAGPWVGEVLLGDGLRLRLVEKVEGTLQALLEWSSPTDVRMEHVKSATGESGTLIEIFARRFLHHLGEVLHQGLPRAYSLRRDSINRVRGRIAVRATLTTWARGRPDRVVCAWRELDPDTPANRLLAVGLGAVEQASDVLLDWNKSLSARARAVAPLFEGVDSASIRRLDHAGRLAVFKEGLARPEVTGELRSAVSYAQALALHLGAWSETVDSSVPSTFLLNLETLFEDAVRAALVAALPDVRVRKGADCHRRLLSGVSDRYEAKPDLVLSRDARLVVGDVKYKDLRGLPDHSDVYQLLSHAIAFDAPRAVLIYAGESYAHHQLGTAGPVQFSYAEVRAARLGDDLRDLATDLGFVDE